MINKVERGQSSATATVLGRLSGAFGLTLSTLLARAEGDQKGRLVRAADQAVWRDPATGYVRRQIAPAAGSDLPLDIVHVELPAGQTVTFPASAFAFIRQIVWVLKGHLTFIEGGQTHELHPGDCLELGPPDACTFENRSKRPCSYIVAIVRP